MKKIFGTKDIPDHPAFFTLPRFLWKNIFEPCVTGCNLSNALFKDTVPEFEFYLVSS